LKLQIILQNCNSFHQLTSYNVLVAKKCCLSKVEISSWWWW